MRNTLEDLNNHLFAQLERLNEESIGEDELRKEIARTEAIVSVANSIVGNANTVIKALQLKGNGFIDADIKIPKMLGE